ncbi:hypothetical protein FB45DRAFT_1020334 [Roridomyces roridus]|uniref:Uncharacterized protein n=1 Tax=Roridomyces roridus TaxID=1738132 RepID=A0AAD7CGW6_9AGAR|nr:hypothetical protein FB45DRAFT_1020334 [Roridomyces roridus]
MPYPHTAYVARPNDILPWQRAPGIMLRSARPLGLLSFPTLTGSRLILDQDVSLMVSAMAIKIARIAIAHDFGDSWPGGQLPTELEAFLDLCEDYRRARHAYFHNPRNPFNPASSP